MQKVVGSSPIIRSPESPRSDGVLFCPEARVRAGERRMISL